MVKKFQKLLYRMRGYCNLKGVSLLLAGVVLCAVCGCQSKQEYKKDADDEVYDIINAKWQDKHGSKTNYKVQDTEKAPNSIDPNEVITTEGELSLAKAVAIATSNSRDYQRRKENLYLSALDLTLERHEYAKQWFATFDTDYSNDQGTDENVSYGGDGGFSQTLADGTEVTTSIALDWMRYLTGSPRTSLGSVLSATITKPLLKGSEKAIVQENLTQAERQVLYDIRSFNRYRKTFVVQVINQYYRVLQNRDNVANAESNYENLQFANERASMMAEAGRLPKLQADQTEQSLLRAEDSLARAKRNYQQSLDEFKILLALPTEANITLDPNELTELGESNIEMPEFTETEATQIALENRLDLANEQDQVDDAKRKIEVAADNLGISLDFSAGMNVSSPSGEQRPANLQFQEGNYSAGLSFDPDIDKKAERNAYRRRLIQFNQVKRNYQQATDEVKLDVRDAYRSLNEAATRYEIQLQALKLAEERVKNTNMLLNAGRATSRDLLEAQADLLDAQNSKTSTLIDFTIEMLNFYRDVGMLTVKPDGMWEIG